MLTPEVMKDWSVKIGAQEKEKMLAALSISAEVKSALRKGEDLETHKAGICALRDPIIQVCRALPLAQIQELRAKHSIEKLPYLFKNLFNTAIIFKRLDLEELNSIGCCQELLRINEIDKALELLDIFPAEEQDNALHHIALACVGRSLFVNDVPTKRQIRKALDIANRIVDPGLRVRTVSISNSELACLYCREGKVEKGLTMLDSLGETVDADVMDTAYRKASRILFDKNPDAVQALFVARKIIDEHRKSVAITYICEGLCELNNLEQALDVANYVTDQREKNNVLRSMINFFFDTKDVTGLNAADFAGAMKMAFLTTNSAERSLVISEIADRYFNFTYKERQDIIEGLAKATTDQELEDRIGRLNKSPDAHNFFIEYLAHVIVDKNVGLEEISQKILDHNQRNRIFAFMSSVFSKKSDFMKAVAVRDAIRDSEPDRTRALDYIVAEFRRGKIVSDEATMASLADACSEADLRHLIHKLNGYPSEEIIQGYHQDDVNIIAYVLVHKNLNHKDFLNVPGVEVIEHRIPASIPWMLSLQGKFKEAIDTLNSLSTSEFVSESQLAKDISDALSEIFKVALEKIHEPAEMMALIDMFTSSNAWKKSVGASRQKVGQIELEKVKTVLMDLKPEDDRKKQLARDYSVYYYIPILLWFGRVDVAELYATAILDDEIKKKAQELLPR